MNRLLFFAFVAFVVVVSLAGCSRSPEAVPPDADPQRVAVAPVGGCKLAGDWTGQFFITQADGIALPANPQDAIPTQLRFTEAGAVTMAINGVQMTYERPGQLLMGDPFSNRHFATEVTKLDVQSNRVLLQTRGRSGVTQPDHRDPVLNEASETAEMVFTLQGDDLEVKSTGNSLRGGRRSTMLMTGSFRRVGGAPTATPIKKSPVGNQPVTASENYYPLEIGTIWRSRINGMAITMTVIAEEDLDGVRAARVEANVNGRATATEHLVRRADGIYRVAFNGNRLDPQVLVLRLPPKAGDRWKVNVFGQAGESVVSQETVTVPAGQFTAFKVRTVIANGTTAETWFARGYGAVKQRIVEDGQELVVELEKLEPGR
jgi:hypothetical protein